MVNDNINMASNKIVQDELFESLVMICALPSVRMQVTDDWTTNYGISNRAAAIQVRNSICNAFTRRHLEKSLDVSSSQSVNEVVYEAVRDGFVEAVAQSYGPGRVSGPERIELSRVVDTIRVQAPFDRIQIGDQVMDYEVYYSTIVAAALPYVNDIHAVVRASVTSSDYTDAANSFASLVRIALAPFVAMSYLSHMSTQTELTLAVQISIKVMHRNLLAQMIDVFVRNTNLFAPQEQTDNALIVTMTAIGTAINDSAIERLSSTAISDQMAIVTQTSINANQAYSDLKTAQSKLSDRVSRVRDYNYRNAVEAEEIAHERNVMYAWVLACVAFFGAASLLLVTEKYKYLLILVGASFGIFAMSIAAELIVRFMR